MQIPASSQPVFLDPRQAQQSTATGMWCYYPSPVVYVLVQPPARGALQVSDWSALSDALARGADFDVLAHTIEETHQAFCRARGAKAGAGPQLSAACCKALAAHLPRALAATRERVRASDAVFWSVRLGWFFQVFAYLDRRHKAPNSMLPLIARQLRQMPADGVRPGTLATMLYHFKNLRPTPESNDLLEAIAARLPHAAPLGPAQASRALNGLRNTTDSAALRDVLAALAIHVTRCELVGRDLALALQGLRQAGASPQAEMLMWQLARCVQQSPDFAPEPLGWAFSGVRSAGPSPAAQALLVALERHVLQAQRLDFASITMCLAGLRNKGASPVAQRIVCELARRLPAAGPLTATATQQVVSALVGLGHTPAAQALMAGVMAALPATFAFHGTHSEARLAAQDFLALIGDLLRRTAADGRAALQTQIAARVVVPPPQPPARRAKRVPVPVRPRPRATPAPAPERGPAVGPVAESADEPLAEPSSPRSNHDVVIPLALSPARAPSTPGSSPPTSPRWVHVGSVRAWEDTARARVASPGPSASLVDENRYAALRSPLAQTPETRALRGARQGTASAALQAPPAPVPVAPPVVQAAQSWAGALWSRARRALGLG